MFDSARPMQLGEAQPPRLLTAKQLGRLMGLSERTIRRHDSAGFVPRPLNIGGAVRWRADEIDAWVTTPALRCCGHSGMASFVIAGTG